MSGISVVHLLAPFGQSPFLFFLYWICLSFPYLFGFQNWFLDFLQSSRQKSPILKPGISPLEASL